MLKSLFVEACVLFWKGEVDWGKCSEREIYPRMTEDADFSRWGNPDERMMSVSI